MFLVEQLRQLMAQNPGANADDIRYVEDRGSTKEYRSEAMRYILALERHWRIPAPGTSLPCGERFDRLMEKRTAMIQPTQQLILFKGQYNEKLLQANSHLFFVFGDNNKRVGKGGQAIIRDEPNALGVSTKRSPGEFMGDSLRDLHQVSSDLIRLQTKLEGGHNVIIPVTKEDRISLGLGLAELPYRAPRCYALIEHAFEQMKKEFGYESR